MQQVNKCVLAPLLYPIVLSVYVLSTADKFSNQLYSYLVWYNWIIWYGWFDIVQFGSEVAFEKFPLSPAQQRMASMHTRIRIVRVWYVYIYIYIYIYNMYIYIWIYIYIHIIYICSIHGFELQGYAVNWEMRTSVCSRACMYVRSMLAPCAHTQVCVRLYGNVPQTYSLSYMCVIYVRAFVCIELFSEQCLLS